MSSRLTETEPVLDEHGALPDAGPVPYLTLNERYARSLLEGPRPEASSTWMHATTEQVAVTAAHRGLIPSCWHGGDGCVVFGSSGADDVNPRRGQALVEVHSRALAGQLRAWWVPLQHVRGAWIYDEFITAERLREANPEPAPLVAPCSCPLAALVREQQDLWRRTYSADTPRPGTHRRP